ncbi:MAG: hypothetical protein CMF62_00355 [Magnetococcales bacterium]|nr:hypothetical protein [Magnetococcales bacterium]
MKINIKKAEGEKKFITIYGYKTQLDLPLILTIPPIVVPIGDINFKSKQNCLRRILDNGKEQVLLRNEPTNNFLNILGNEYYINTSDDLEKFYNEFEISKNKFPVSYPLRIFTLNTNETIYYNNLYFDINKKNVIKYTKFKKRLPLSLTIFATSCVFGIVYMLK